MRLLILLTCLAVAGDVRAQALPSEPISVANGRFVFGAEVFATFGDADPGFFNYTDYEYGAFRNVRLAVSTEVRVSRRMQVLAELRLDHGDQLTPYALFVRVRPWPGRRFDVQVGRVPPTFGAFNKTVYAYSNLVIGQPLAYQYLLSIKPDAVPRTADDLLRMRGRGWLSDFPVGLARASPGMPIVNTARFDSGVQVHGVAGPVEWTGALTTGSLSDPRVGDNNGRPQVSTRVVAQLAPGFRVGGSAAHGPWLDAALNSAIPGGVRASDFAQSAVAADVEVSQGAWLARAELLRSAWNLPALGTPAIDAPLVARSLIVEGRYRVWPGVSVSARADGLWFSDVAGSAGVQPWEANQRRLETALSVAITRNLIAKGAWQRNHRQGGRVRHDSLVAAQLVYWF
ncbi:MAG: hypothetical protein AB7H81_04965 [Vicinamibacterales bacterium]